MQSNKKTELAGGLVCLPINRIRTHVYDINRSTSSNINNQQVSEEMSVITYYYLDNRIKRS